MFFYLQSAKLIKILVDEKINKFFCLLKKCIRLFVIIFVTDFLDFFMEGSVIK